MPDAEQQRLFSSLFGCTKIHFWMLENAIYTIILDTDRLNRYHSKEEELLHDPTSDFSSFKFVQGYNLLNLK